jgi:uroporphyrinogen decarboxylase
MNNKLNALEIIRFGKPERVMAGIPSYGVGYHGVNHQGYGDAGMASGHDRPVGSKWFDIWGVGWHKEYPDVMGFPKINPLADMAALKGYKWPDPDDERLCAPIYESAGAFENRGEFFINCSHRDTLWEKSYMLVGMENMMSYFYTEPSYAREILRRIMDFQLGMAMHYVGAGAEIASLGDDLGTQRSLLLGQGIFDEFLEPEYRRIFEFYKSRNILIEFHSCGHIEPLLESFIGLGVNVLNPVQATANDLGAVIGVTRNRMALKGGISTGLLMDGAPGQIRAAVRDAIALLGKGGGYFCAPDQGMPFPAANYAAYEDAVSEFGSYE